jgi:tetratricopeptide (TPR) repeat protein
MQHQPAAGQDPEANARALEAADRPQEALQAWADLARTRAVGAARAAALTEEARLHGELGRPDQARACYRRALVNDPRSARALAALAEIALRERDWTRLAHVFRLRFAAETDSAQRSEIALAAGRLEIERLHAPGAARHWILAGLACAPVEPGLLDLRVELERTRGDDGALLEALEQWIAVAEDAAEPARRIEAAKLWSTRDESERAVAHLERAMDQAPEDLQVLDAVAGVLSGMNRPSDLADVLERRVALLGDDPETAGPILLELGGLLEDRLFDLEGAHDAYQRALSIHPENPLARGAVMRLGAKLENDEALALPASEPAPEPAPSGPIARALADLEREAHETTDRTRLGLLVREIEALHLRRGDAARALPWIQRWVAVAPEDPEALRALAHTHERLGNDSERVATLRALDPLLSVEERRRGRRRIAMIYTEQGRDDEAIQSWHGALALDPRDELALDALAALHRSRSEPDALLAVLQRLVGLTEPQSRPARWVEIAELQREAGDASAELATLLALEGEVGVPAEVETRIDDLLDTAERYDELATRWELRRNRLGSEPEALELDLRRAALLRGTLGRPDAAARVYREVLERGTESPEAKAGLEQSLRDAFDAEGLAALLAMKAESASDAPTRERATLERAALLEEVLDRPDDALAAYRELAMRAADGDVRAEAVAHYERRLERRGDWQTLRDHLAGNADEGSPEERIARQERLARLCADRLDDSAGEREHLETIVALDPSRGDVWRMLSERHERAGRLEECGAAMEQEIAAGCDPSRARTLHARLAAWYRHDLDDQARACAHYESAFELDPSDTSAARYLTERYEADDRPEDLLRLLEARLAATGRDGGASPSEDPTALRIRIARVRGDQLDDVEGAISALEVALGEVGPVPQVAEALAACYERAGYTLDLIELCRSAASRCRESAESANWWIRMGDALLSRDRAREAADAYHHALTERPNDRAVQASLRAIHRKLGGAVPLAELLEAELEHLAGPDEIPVRMELAALYHTDLARPEAALLHMQRVLQLSPRHPEAFSLAVELAQRLDRGDEALALLDWGLARSRDTATRADLQARRARLLSGALGRPDEGIEAFRAALTLAPVEALRDELAALLETRGRWSELLEVVAEQARAASPPARSGWLERGAEIASDHIDAAASLPWLEQLRVARPDDLGVLRRIAEVHRTAGRSEALLRTLHACVALASTPEQRRDLELERATVLELELDAPSRALVAVAAARDAMPGDPEVLERLEGLQRLLERDAERVKTLETLIALRPEQAGELHARLAALKTGPLADPTGAIPHWEMALELAGSTADRIGQLRSLAGCYRHAADLEGWARTAETELASLDPAPVFDDRRRTLRRELAFAYDGPLARPEPALRHACALLDAGEDDLIVPDVLERMEALVLRRLRETDAPAELEVRLVRHLERRPEDVALWLELARLREERLHASGAAIDAYRHTLELDPRNLEALRGMRRAAERLGRWTDVADALERELDHPDITDASVRAALLRRLGDIHWHRLQSTTRASRCYAAALENDGADFASLRALERLLESMEDWRGALDLYESEVEVLGDDDPQRRREIWLHVAELAQERTEDLDRARRALECAADVAPLDASGLSHLMQLHERRGDIESLVETLALWCADPAAGAGPEDHLRLSTHLEGLGRTDDALAAVEGALTFDPAAPDAWDATARLRERIGDAEGAVSALRCAAERARGAAGAKRLLHAATLIETSAPRASLDLLRDAATQDPTSVPVHAARARLALELDHPTEAEAAAAAALDLDTREALETTHALEIALIGGDAARSRGRLSEAAAFYGRARGIDAQDPRANGGYGESMMALGDPGEAREALETRLARGDAYPERARHRSLLASCLEEDGEIDAALDAVDAALLECPQLDDALAMSARLREALGRTDEAVGALETWAKNATLPADRSARLLRAAECELRHEGREASAEAHLREALAADTSEIRAWIALGELLVASGRLEGAIECTDRAATHANEDQDLAALALLQGRAYEQRGERLEAAESFGMAAQADPHCVQAALTQARLLRGAGEWGGAARALEAFLEGHDAPDDPSLADVHEQLGRLLAGPLEDVNAATLAYRRAIDLDPTRLPSRSALAELLSHRPGDREEAIEQLRLLLDANPTDAACLRVAIRIARANAEGAGIETGIAVLRSLGLASIHESEEPHGPPPPPTPILHDTRFEQLRCIAQEASEGIAKALEASGAPASRTSEGPEAAFRDAMLRAEGRLTAPSLVPLTTREIAEILSLVVRLTVEPESVHGDGHQVNALTEALRRRERRRLRRWVGDTPTHELCDVDFEQWRTEVRALAAATAIGEAGLDLRTALIALLREEDAALDSRLRDSADLAPLVATSPIARSLLRRIVTEWVDRI